MFFTLPPYGALYAISILKYCHDHKTPMQQSENKLSNYALLFRSVIKKFSWVFHAFDWEYQKNLMTFEMLMIILKINEIANQSGRTAARAFVTFPCQCRLLCHMMHHFYLAPFQNTFCCVIVFCVPLHAFGCQHDDFLTILRSTKYCSREVLGAGRY